MGNSSKGTNKDNQPARIKHMQPHALKRLKSDTAYINRFTAAEERRVYEHAHVCSDMTARAYSTNYFQSLISDSSGTEPQQGHLVLMLLALCEYIYTAAGLWDTPCC